MKHNFYKAFEARFRGEREEIKKRQAIYLPLVKPVCKKHPQKPVVDIGAGRGEWLESLQEQEILAEGYDVDKALVEEAVGYGLQVKEEDGVEALTKMPDASVCVVTAFHVVEHLPFDRWMKLIREANRILVPGGVLILETPNPENIRVASEHFYLDPTHRNPIPARLLAFGVEYGGFERASIVRLQENPCFASEVRASIHQVLEGPSQDYAVVGQKDGDNDLFEQIGDSLARLAQGLSFEETVRRFEERLLAYDRYLLEAAVREEKRDISALEHAVHILKEELDIVHEALNGLQTSHHGLAEAFHMSQQKPQTLYGQFIDWFQEVMNRIKK